MTSICPENIGLVQWQTFCPPKQLPQAQPQLTSTNLPRSHAQPTPSPHYLHTSSNDHQRLERDNLHLRGLHSRIPTRPSHCRPRPCHGPHRLHSRRERRVFLLRIWRQQHLRLLGDSAHGDGLPWGVSGFWNETWLWEWAFWVAEGELLGEVVPGMNEMLGLLFCGDLEKSLPLVNGRRSLPRSPWNRSIDRAANSKGKSR